MYNGQVQVDYYITDIQVFFVYVCVESNGRCGVGIVECLLIFRKLHPSETLPLKIDCSSN